MNKRHMIYNIMQLGVDDGVFHISEYNGAWSALIDGVRYILLCALFDYGVDKVLEYADRMQNEDDDMYEKDEYIREALKVWRAKF